jgi:hypothetical protein
VGIEDQADIALLDDIGNVAQLHVVIIPGTHTVKEQLCVIDDAHTTPGDLQDISMTSTPGRTPSGCRDGIDGAPAGGLGQQEAQG